MEKDIDQIADGLVTSVERTEEAIAELKDSLMARLRQDTVLKDGRVVDRFVLHIIGPDDVIEQPSELAALREANRLNKGALSRMAGDGKDPLFLAVVKDRSFEEV